MNRSLASTKCFYFIIIYSYSNRLAFCARLLYIYRRVPGIRETLGYELVHGIVCVHHENSWNPYILNVTVQNS